MTTDYFRQLRTETPTRVWVNNPTDHEVELALAQGADGCTTNPAYVASLLRRAPDPVRQTITQVAHDDASDETIAGRVQLALVDRIAARFRGVHLASDGRAGFVSIQGSPFLDENPAAILDEAVQARRLGPNVAPKIPATAAGLAAFEALVRDGAPTIVTEVFSVAQLIETCERYLAADSLGRRPAFFVSPITGIFGDHLKAVATREGVTDSGAATEFAGLALARACYRVAHDRAYPVRLLCGGARTQMDLTALVGGSLSVTVNWSTFAELLESGEAPVPRIDVPLDAALIDGLTSSFPDVELALRPDGLELDAFAEFGPVRHFRSVFETGWAALLDAVREHREAVPAGQASQSAPASGQG